MGGGQKCHTSIASSEFIFDKTYFQCIIQTEFKLTTSFNNFLDKMLDNFVLPIIPQRGNKDEMHFTHDGEPHFALPANTWLDNHFTGRWIGCQGPTKTTP